MMEFWEAARRAGAIWGAVELLTHHDNLEFAVLVALVLVVAGFLPAR